MSARDTSTKIIIPPYVLPYIHTARPLDSPSQQSLNPHIVLHFDIVRNQKTIHFEYDLSKPPSLDRQHTKTMRGYHGIMGSSDCSCDLNGNGEKVHIQQNISNCLWQPSNNGHKEEPVWHLRVTVLKDQESRADAPGRRFNFKSMHHLTHAANQLEAAFGSTFDLRKCGMETPDAMGGRVNDGRSANVTIEFESDIAQTKWAEFLSQLKTLEDEWDLENRLEPVSVM